MHSPCQISCSSGQRVALVGRKTLFWTTEKNNTGMAKCRTAGEMYKNKDDIKNVMSKVCRVSESVWFIVPLDTQHVMSETNLFRQSVVLLLTAKLSTLTASHLFDWVKFGTH